MLKKVLITLFLTLFVTACSSSGKLTQTVAPTSVIDHTAYANLSVSTGQDDDAKDFANRLQDRLFGKLVSRKVFTSVNQNDATAKYDLEITISGAKKVSGAARVLFGVFAGSNNVTADVTLTDKNTGEVITTFKAEGKSASHPFSSESGAEDAIREVSEQIVTGLL
ncbi:DUF4410 domain-containing protein [uncultured Kiloniella sp.]|uniref:DUF4410 domain-containing protein n=1 Tax=uncultured Kiloniella sp. TaxID=1133091 RepID=UPI00260EC7BE|nr:DUF4410 domain-containing protein [uncultured Kiloniella sp.]